MGILPMIHGRNARATTTQTTIKDTTNMQVQNYNLDKIATATISSTMQSITAGFDFRTVVADI